jgi:CRP/FNR family transcriptional regulator, cyclic AMP receptor protein
MKIGDVNFEEITLFKDMPSTALDKIRAIFDVRSLDAGENLITEGEPGDEMFILVSGRVRISKSMLMEGMDLPIMEVGNLRKVLATVDESSYPIFGEIALIDRDTRSATIHVLEPSHFLVTDRARFFDFLDREPAIGNKLFAALARRMAATIRNSNSELVKLSTALALALSRCGARP